MVGNTPKSLSMSERTLQSQIGGRQNQECKLALRLAVLVHGVGVNRSACGSISDVFSYACDFSYLVVTMKRLEVLPLRSYDKGLGKCWA
jgi:hypothetical protein